MSQKEKRPKLKVVGHYRLVEGVKVEIDPFDTDLPDRCKLIVSEVVTGQKCTLTKII